MEQIVCILCRILSARAIAKHLMEIYVTSDIQDIQSFVLKYTKDEFRKHVTYLCPRLLSMCVQCFLIVVLSFSL